MALDLQISRLAKLLVDSEGISFDEAQIRLRKLRLEVLVGEDAISAAAHAAVLTTIAVGLRSFIGGVRIRGYVDQSLNSAMPVPSGTLRDAARYLGSTDFDGEPSRRISVGSSRQAADSWFVSASIDGWSAGRAVNESTVLGNGDNPLTGVVAGGLAVGAAFDAERGAEVGGRVGINLWPTMSAPPKFREVFLPGALWLIGLGNLGQSYLWSISSLPYEDPSTVSLVLQDADKVNAENWSTSVLVHQEVYGLRKTFVGERWALAKGFDVRRIDRRMVAADRLDDGDPRIALSGVDRVSARRALAPVGFHLIMDAGLGRTMQDFDRYRVSLFDETRSIDEHFATLTDDAPNPAQDLEGAYRTLEAEVGRCGAAEIAGASVATPYVSVVAGAILVGRLIAALSGQECPVNEVGKISALDARRLSPPSAVKLRSASHAGNPAIA